MSKPRVLFVCVRNSARSQMAEAFLRELAPERFEAHSAGLRPTGLLPEAVAVMAEAGLDISGRPTRGVFDLAAQGQSFDYLVTLCDSEQARQCPDFPPPCRRLHWCFDEPSAFQGSWEDRLAQTRRVREEIRAAVETWVEAMGRGGPTTTN